MIAGVVAVNASVVVVAKEVALLVAIEVQTVAADAARDLVAVAADSVV